MVCTPPVRDLVCDELRAMVTFHIPRSAALGEQPLEHPSDITRRDRPGAVNGQPFTGRLIQPGQALPPPPIGALVVDQLVAPDLVGMRGPGRHRRVRPDGAPAARVLDHLEALALPKAADRFATDGPLFGLQQGEDLAISKPRCTP
jgi:hypothetical protein